MLYVNVYNIKLLLFLNQLLLLLLLLCFQLNEYYKIHGKLNNFTCISYHQQ